MGSMDIHSISIFCRLEGIKILSAVLASTPTDTVILQHNQPYSLQVSVEFIGSNAIALLALTPTLRADFYATPVGVGQSMTLGTVCLSSQPQQQLYTLELKIPSIDNAGLEDNRVYRLSALVRIGATDQPAILCGVLEAPIVQICGDSS
ncbi:MAG: hypothetical protein AAF921_01690 [Cyanobacteria bacterium P01_D01_bin.44]